MEKVKKLKMKKMMVFKLMKLIKFKFSLLQDFLKRNLEFLFKNGISTIT